MSHDLVLAGGSVADVRTGTIRRAAIGIDGDRIAALGPDDTVAAGARRVHGVSGHVLVPGYVEAHTHIALAAPWEFASALLVHGTTSAFVDALPLMSLARSEEHTSELQSPTNLVCR